MKDITHIVDHYRSCVRTLWNDFFADETIFQIDWDFSDEFEDICVKIFDALVLNRIGKFQEKKAPKYYEFPAALSFISVVPAADEGVPIQIAREKANARYWDHPVNIIKPGDSDMRFVDFFNANTTGSRDYEYCRVRIVASSVYPDTVGRDALLEWKDVRIMLDDHHTDQA